MQLVIHSCRRAAATIFVGVFIVGALWWGLWNLATSQFDASIDGWIASGRAAGYTITYTSRESFGFPHRVVLRFNGVDWKNPNGIAFHADQMDLSSLPWEKEVFEASFRGHAELAVPLDADGKGLLLAGENGRAHVVLNPDGVWKLSKVSLMQGKFGRTPDFLFQADKLAATAERPQHPPKDHTEPGLTLSGYAENLAFPAGMPAPFGPRATTIDLALRVMGEAPDFRRKDSVAAWNGASGVVEFDNLHMEWGPLRMTAKGTLGFDDDLQPEGAFSSAIGNHEEVLKALMDKGFVPQRQAAMLNSALNLFAKPAGGKGDLEMPITVQLGGLFLGPVRIFVFPMITWPKADKPATQG